jgi:ELWxxDGT repeat protein
MSVFVHAQISLVKDIQPGSAGALSESAIKGIYYNNRLIFPANTSEFGNELWISDGTEVGTVQLKDIHPGTASSDPARFIIAFDKVYFAATTPDEGKELWVTDGTEEGTILVADIEDGASSGDPLFGAVYKDYLYFAATSGADREIWRVDALNNTALFYNLNPTAQSKPRSFTVLGDKMYFAANEHPVDLSANDEDEPFVTDGTIEGTVKLIDVTIDSRGAGVRDFVALGTDVFFLASTNGGANPNDHEIFKTDGTPGNTLLLQDLLGSQWLTPYSNYILFFYESGFYRMTPDGAVTLISGIHNDDAYFTSNKIINFNNALFMPAENNSTGVELFTSKATPATTFLLKDINPGTEGSNPLLFTVANDKLVFVASASETNRELFETDGTAEGTKMVMDINPGDEGSNPASLVHGGDAVFFYAFTPETGFELFKYDLEPSATTRISKSFEGKVFPQPANEYVTIEWSEKDLWIKGKLIDQDGRFITSFHVENLTTLQVDFTQIPGGLYYFILTNESNETSFPIIRQ